MWRYNTILENRRGRILLKKLIMVFLWLILAAGIYWCNVSTQEKDEQESSEENEDSNKKDANRENVNDIVQDIKEISRAEALSENIRVLIKTDSFQGIYHGEIKVVCDNGLIVEHGKTAKEYGGGEEYVINKGCFQNGSASIKIRGKDRGALRIVNLKRNAEVSYRGSLECYDTSDGIVLVNELKVEEYLYGVVPSEMPSSYPAEALKAQAISARTYTYFHKQRHVQLYICALKPYRRTPTANIVEVVDYTILNPIGHKFGMSEVSA